MDNKETGTLIAARRQELGWTQKQLAEQLHISDRTVSKWERAAGFPDISLLEPLADALGLSVLELIHGRLMSLEEHPAPESERSFRAAARTLGERAGRHLRRYRLALIVLAALLACALAGLALLWLNPTRVHTSDRQEVSAARALEIYPFSLITVEEWELARLLQDALPSAGDNLDSFGEEMTAFCRELVQIEGRSVDSFRIEVVRNVIYVDYSQGNRRCILTIFDDKAIRKTACEYKSDGPGRTTGAVVENEDNIRFFMYRTKRDLLAPLFLE